ncbi:hypothetical protein N2152v2_009469 [Parachlorella kessleri]
MADLAGLMGAYGSDEESEQMEGEAGGQVTVMGREDEDEEMVGVDLSHLTTTAARAEPDTAGTQPAAGPGQQQQQVADLGAAFERLPGGAAGGTNADAMDGAAQPDADEASPPASILPPEVLQPPEGECNPAVQGKIAFWLNIQRTQGRTLNQQLRHSRAYRNPEFFRKMVEQFEVDEYGSCFAKEVFDPRGLCKEDYIEELQKEWAAEEERRKAQRQATGRIEFTKSASQPNLAPNPLLPGLNPAAALAAAQLKAAQLAAGMGGAPAAAGQGGGGAASGAGKGGSKFQPSDATTTDKGSSPESVVLEVTGARQRVLDAAGQQRPRKEFPSWGPGSSLKQLQSPLLVDPVGAVRSLFIPRGWPHSVTPDYVEYQLWSVPCHILGWLSHSLATSSMLQAVGLGVGPVGVAGTSAAIKWITKDGLGAAGRLFVAGRLSTVFDEDPKRWRLNAELVNSCGLALEIATQLFPGNFVLLAGAGTLARALSKGMGRPCFRVVQTYFAAANNVGDVSAKEEVWEVVGQLLGLAASVATLKALDLTGQPADFVVPVWAAVQGTHIVLRYKALSTLRFPYPNQRRAAALVTVYVMEGRVPGVDEVNRGENPFIPASSCNPRAVFGCTVEEALQGFLATSLDSNGNGYFSDSGQHSSSLNGTGNGSNGSKPDGQPQEAQRPLQSLIELYHGEQFLLTWHHSTAYVLLWEGAGPRDYMRAMLQAAWLERRGHASATKAELGAGLRGMQTQWQSFERLAAEQGWNLDKAIVPLRGTCLKRL